MRWILGAIALIAVIAVTAVVAVSCAGGKGSDNGGGGTTASGAKSDIASANDTGPVSVITEDPSCAPWQPVNNIVGNAEKNGWDQRDPSISASAWTPDVQAMYRSVGDAMRLAADQAVPLTKITPHRVMRELYEQYIAYTRAFVDRIPSYTQNDDNILATAATAGSVINGICAALTSGSAATRGPLVAAGDTPSAVSPIGNSEKPDKFLPAPDPQCANWNRASDQLTSDPAFSVWLKTDSNIPASSWSAQDKSINDAVKPVFSRTIDEYAKLASQSSNPAAADFGMLAVQYGHAFVQGMPTYTSTDMNLYLVFLRAPGIITSACKAAGAN